MPQGVFQEKILRRRASNSGASRALLGIDMTYRFRPSREGLQLACGVAGLVTVLTGLAAPAAGATTPSAPGSNAGNLRQAHRAARPSEAGPAGTFTPKFSCKKAGTSHSVQATVTLAALRTHASYNPKSQLVFSMSATPSFGVELHFTGNVSCTATDIASFPLGDGLVLKTGPSMTFTTSGDVNGNFTWKPAISAGFTLTSKGFVKHSESVTNAGGASFSGKGTATLGLGLETEVATTGGIVGIKGDIGPTMTVRVNGDTRSKIPCWDAGITSQATFNAYVTLFKFLRKDQVLGPLRLGQSTASGSCPVTFVGTPGTGAPPARLGPYTMTAFPADPTPEGADESRVTGPTGAITFGAPLQHDVIGSDWATWSHGYTGDVYENDTVLPNGDLQVTVTLPPGTGAFYAYAEPNEFQDYAMSAVADGIGSGDITVAGDGGAQYFGYYAPCGHAIHSITYTDSGGDSAMAVGEFGIARSC
jgi:hypothetical protein